MGLNTFKDSLSHFLLLPPLLRTQNLLDSEFRMIIGFWMEVNIDVLENPGMFIIWAGEFGEAM